MTLFEVGARVPLIIVDPSRPASHGTRTRTPTGLIDMYPTIVSLAGLPAPPTSGHGRVEGTDLSPLFDSAVDGDFSGGTGAADRTDGSTGAAVGGGSATRPVLKTMAFSQQAKCFSGRRETLPQDLDAPPSYGDVVTCTFVHKNAMDFMGMSVRTVDWRYNEWRAWDRVNFKANFSGAALMGSELYDHRSGEAWGQENENVAADPAHAGVVGELAKALREHFQ
jgi:hypothetical protein